MPNYPSSRDCRTAADECGEIRASVVLVKRSLRDSPSRPDHVDVRFFGGSLMASSLESMPCVPCVYTVNLDPSERGFPFLGPFAYTALYKESTIVKF